MTLLSHYLNFDSHTHSAPDVTAINRYGYNFKFQYESHEGKVTWNIHLENTYFLAPQGSEIDPSTGYWLSKILSKIHFLHCPCRELTAFMQHVNNLISKCNSFYISSKRLLKYQHLSDYLQQHMSIHISNITTPNFWGYWQIQIVMFSITITETHKEQVTIDRRIVNNNLHFSFL